MTDTNQKKLGNTLWSIGNQLRGAMDADDPPSIRNFPTPLTREHFRI